MMKRPAGQESREKSAFPYLGILLLFLGLLWLFRAVLLGSGYFFGDFANQDLPKLFYNAREILKGNFPAWCPYHDLGRPFGQMAWHCIFYPLYLLCLPFAKNLASFEKAVSLVYIFQVFWGALGVYFLLRFWKVSRAAATAGAAAAGYCASVVITITSANNGAGYGWLPWVMLGLEYVKVYAQESFSLRGWRAAILTGAALGLAFLVGVIQRMPYMAAFLLGFFIFSSLSLLREKKALLRYCVYALGALILSVCFSALLLFPAFEYYANSGRPDVDIYKEISNQARWLFFLTNLVPGIFGRVNAPGSTPDWNFFWGSDNFLPGQFWQFWCRVSYGGLFAFLGILLIPFFLFREKKLLYYFLALSALLATLYIYGLENPLQYGLAAIIKPLRSLRIPVRYAYFISLPLGLLSAFLLDAYWPKAKQKIPLGFWLFALVSVLLLAGSFFLTSSYVPNSPFAQKLYNAAFCRQGLLLGAGLIFYFLAARGFGEATKWGVALLVLLDLISFGGEINASPRSAAEENQSNPVVLLMQNERLKAGPNGRFRYRWDAVQASQKTVLWELDSVNGYIMTRTFFEEPLFVSFVTRYVRSFVFCMYVAKA